MEKKRYKFSDGEALLADEAELRRLLTLNKGYVANYLELEDCMDDAAFVARGNGFCDSKYSADFLEGQLAFFQQRVADLERWLAELSV